MLGGHADIAYQSEGQPTAHGDAVDGGDHRNVELVDAGVQVGQADLRVVVDLERRARRGFLLLPAPTRAAASAAPAQNPRPAPVRIAARNSPPPRASRARSTPSISDPSMALRRSGRLRVM